MPSKYKPYDSNDYAFDPNYCAASVVGGGRWKRLRQCSRKPWKDGWCKQHHPDNKAKRREEADKRYKAKQANTPSKKLVRMTEQRDILLEACKATYAWFIGLDCQLGHHNDTVVAQLRDAIERVKGVNL